MQSEKSCKLNIITLSDIHLGHRKNNTRNIVANILRMLPDDAKMASTDAIFIPGDLFDKAVSLASDDAYEIITGIGYLLKLCEKHNIVLRILEGTPSHDWKQTRILDAINNYGGANVDAKWVSTLSIEFHKTLGISILYIPDEWKPDTEDTWSDVVHLLKEHNLDKVDVILMHGQFAYQLPEHVKASFHEVDRYNAITNYVCYCGHVHTHSVKGKIVVPGSFDRLAHNEEGPKGLIRSIIDLKLNTTTHVFDENRTAMVFKTINCCDMTLEKAFSLIDKHASRLPDDSHVCLVLDKSNVASECMAVVKNKYPMFNWTSKTAKENKTIQPIVDKRSMLNLKPINERTIVDLVKDAILSEGVPELTVNKCVETLQEMING